MPNGKEQQITQINLDLTNYEELKAKGLLTPGKIGSAYAVVIKQFNPSTGKEIDSKFVPLSIAQLEAAAARDRKNADAIDLFVKDLKALDVKPE